MKNMHPYKVSLLEYAEGLIDSTAHLNPYVASHVSDCVTCQAVVDEMRSSLAIIEEVETIDACADLSASILLASKNTPVMPTQRVNRNVFGRVALAAGLLIVAVLFWDATHQTTAQFVNTEYVGDAVIVQAEVLPIVNILPSQVEEVLADAVMGSHHTPGSDWERAQQRAVTTYDDDIAEAQLALANNPGFKRASSVILSNRELKGRTLRNVYIESH